jgi:hypothetical protein
MVPIVKSRPGSAPTRPHSNSQLTEARSGYAGIDDAAKAICAGLAGFTFSGDELAEVCRGTQLSRGP